MNTTQSETRTPQSAIPDHSGFWVLFSTILASSMAFIDSTALNVALPALQQDLNASGADLLWIVNAYSIMLASLLLVGGSLGDRYGRKRVFMVGIVLFAGASLLCGLAPNTTLLIAARALQGIGGALMVPSSLALITVSFDDAARGKAIGTWSAFSTLTTIMGPVIGGFLASGGLWRGVFFINLPLAALALLALWFKVRERAGTTSNAPLDFPGAVLATLGLAGITYGFIQLPSQGVGDPLVLLGLVGGVIALVAFVVVEGRSENPMMPLSVFRSRTFTGTNLATLFLYGALSAFTFLLPLNMIQVQGYSASLAGLTILPFAVLLTVISRFSGAWADRAGARLPLIIGPAIAGAGIFVGALPGLTNGPAEYWTTYFPSIVLLGIGMGITVAPLTTAVMSALEQKRAGIASGVNNAVARTAGVLAIAILGAVVLFAFKSALATRADAIQLDSQTKTDLIAQADKLGDAQPPSSVTSNEKAAVQEQIKFAFVDAFRIASYICAGLAWLAAVLAFLTVPGKTAT
jgi:EmrB/QacA subfamily drug resistance transporter